MHHGKAVVVKDYRTGFTQESPMWSGNKEQMHLIGDKPKGLLKMFGFFNIFFLLLCHSYLGICLEPASLTSENGNSKVVTNT